MTRLNDIPNIYSWKGGKAPNVKKSKGKGVLPKSG